MSGAAFRRWRRWCYAIVTARVPTSLFQRERFRHVRGNSIEEKQLLLTISFRARDRRSWTIFTQNDWKTFKDGRDTIEELYLRYVSVIDIVELELHACKVLREIYIEQSLKVKRRIARFSLSLSLSLSLDVTVRVCMCEFKQSRQEMHRRALFGLVSRAFAFQTRPGHGQRDLTIFPEKSEWKNLESSKQFALHDRTSARTEVSLQCHKGANGIPQKRANKNLHFTETLNTPAFILHRFLRDLSLSI